MQRSLLVKGLFALPAAYICLRPNIANAKSLPPHLQQRIDELNMIDQQKEIARKIKNITAWVDSKYKKTVEDLHTNTYVIDELDFTRIMYDTLPLTPSQRLRVRSKIVDIIEREELTPEQEELMMYLLKYYGCLDE